MRTKTLLLFIPVPRPMLGTWEVLDKYLPFESESEVTQSCPTLCYCMNCRLPGSSIHGTFLARVLEWVAISFSRGSSPSRDQTQVPRIGRQTLSHLSHQGSIYANINCSHAHIWPFLDSSLCDQPSDCLSSTFSTEPHAMRQWSALFNPRLPTPVVIGLNYFLWSLLACGIPGGGF